MTDLLWESKFMIHLHLLLSLLYSVHNKTDESASQTVCFIMVERIYQNYILLINVAYVVATDSALIFFILFFSCSTFIHSLYNQFIKQRGITMN